MQPKVQTFFDPRTSTFSYVVYEQAGGHAAIIDPVLDYDPKSGRTGSRSAQQLADFVRQQQLTLDWILETHAHADHLSAAAWLQGELGGRIAIGKHITLVQQVFKKLYGLDGSFSADGRQFDVLFDEDEVFQIGSMQARALFVPGHTPADVAYLVGDALFAGDTLFPPDVGSARCDFPGGDVGALYDSVQKLYALPDSTRFFACHDYLPAGRSMVQAESSIAAQKAGNIHLNAATRRADFIAMRQARDATLDMPVLILPSLQVNIRAGHLPEPDDNGTRYLKIPLNAVGKELS
ncbi:Glyoxylase, beta-lactamase superfamily II [Andreprevotia lacus DSM 23236]|jgi:glyoxylase-like metal-dependent hydrolase (beta-lactamase superfamily II)|uniref:Glyoxylase, beta-lactamase superfamily II n=1 Tax=Andreprevotia lacus DSM 23236 TaxID=1121001 RepID=A0A1W1XH57_9NEIS|nr:MBL fold metallo-hydrolase [Andreprevotia lacus]SMC23157.1 Glyoxylase, beta-lactamase superfamily II [Andreprevotia lacus DSM 23236]